MDDGDDYHRDSSSSGNDGADASPHPHCQDFRRSLTSHMRFGRNSERFGVG